MAEWHEQLHLNKTVPTGILNCYRDTQREKTTHIGCVDVRQLCLAWPTVEVFFCRRRTSLVELLRTSEKEKDKMPDLEYHQFIRYCEASN